MIKIDVVSECTLWSKKIKKNNTFFNSVLKFFPKKYKFIGKKINLTILLSNNKNIKKLNKDFRNKNMSGLSRSKKLLGHLKEISVVDFDHSDVVRHPLVSKIVKAYTDQEND